MKPYLKSKNLKYICLSYLIPKSENVEWSRQGEPLMPSNVVCFTYKQKVFKSTIGEMASSCNGVTKMRNIFNINQDVVDQQDPGNRLYPRQQCQNVNIQSHTQRLKVLTPRLKHVKFGG
jgi:hypothetical protein